MGVTTTEAAPKYRTSTNNASTPTKAPVMTPTRMPRLIDNHITGIMLASVMEPPYSNMGIRILYSTADKAAKIAISVKIFVGNLVLEFVFLICVFFNFFPPPVLPGSGSLGRQHIVVLSAGCSPSSPFDLANRMVESVYFNFPYLFFFISVLERFREVGYYKIFLSIGQAQVNAITILH